MILFKFVFHKSFGRNRCEKILTWNVCTILSPFCPVFFWLVEFCCSRIKTKREDLFSQQAACKLQAQPLSSYQNPEKNNNNNKTLQNQQRFFGRPGAVVNRESNVFSKYFFSKILGFACFPTSKNCLKFCINILYHFTQFQDLAELREWWHF